MKLREYISHFLGNSVFPRYTSKTKLIWDIIDQFRDTRSSSQLLFALITQRFQHTGFLSKVRLCAKSLLMAPELIFFGNRILVFFSLKRWHGKWFVTAVIAERQQILWKTNVCRVSVRYKPYMVLLEQEEGHSKDELCYCDDLKRRLNEDTDNFPWQNELNAPFFLLFLPMSMENLIDGWNLWA